MLLFQFTNQHLNLYSCKEWCFDCRCPIEIPLQNCFNLIRRKSRQCFNISIEIFRHNHSDTMIFFITHFRWCVCNYLSNCNNSSSFGIKKSIVIFAKAVDIPFGISICRYFVSRIISDSSVSEYEIFVSNMIPLHAENFKRLFSISVRNFTQYKTFSGMI